MHFQESFIHSLSNCLTSICPCKHALTRTSGFNQSEASCQARSLAGLPNSWGQCSRNRWVWHWVNSTDRLNGDAVQSPQLIRVTEMSSGSKGDEKDRDFKPDIKKQTRNHLALGISEELEMFNSNNSISFHPQLQNILFTPGIVTRQWRHSDTSASANRDRTLGTESGTASK